MCTRVICIVYYPIYCSVGWVVVVVVVAAVQNRALVYVWVEHKVALAFWLCCCFAGLTVPYCNRFDTTTVTPTIELKHTQLTLSRPGPVHQENKRTGLETDRQRERERERERGSLWLW